MVDAMKVVLCFWAVQLAMMPLVPGKIFIGPISPSGMRSVCSCDCTCLRARVHVCVRTFMYARVSVLVCVRACALVQSLSRAACSCADLFVNPRFFSFMRSLCLQYML